MSMAAWKAEELTGGTEREDEGDKTRRRKWKGREGGKGEKVFLPGKEAGEEGEERRRGEVKRVRAVISEGQEPS